VDYSSVADAVKKQIPAVQFCPLPPQVEAFVILYTFAMPIRNMDNKDDLQTVANAIAQVIEEISENNFTIFLYHSP